MTLDEYYKDALPCLKQGEAYLKKLIETERMAPTAKNQQPQKIYVLQSEDTLKKLSTLTHCAYGAKTVLLFTYNQEQDWKNPWEDGVHSGVEDEIFFSSG